MHTYYLLSSETGTDASFLDGVHAIALSGESAVK
jgi:hypothetical protein